MEGMPLREPAEVAPRLAWLKAEAAEAFGRRSAPLATSRPVHVRPDGPAWPGAAARLAAVATLLVALPFVLLVRGSVWLHEAGGLSPWLALTLAGSATALLVAAYGAWLSRRVTGRARLSTIVKWVALPLVVGYLGHALGHLSRTHAKTEAVRAQYRAVHPLLRLTLATLILTSDDLVVTDLGRVAGDYARMGLPLNGRSPHYRQPDGWLHAVDIRTTGHTAVRNWLLGCYFRIMGFRTLRHVGTADHLHVELR